MNSPADPPGRWQVEANRLAAMSIAGGDPTAWFERIYTAGEGGRVTMPWDREAANPLLVEWAQDRGLDGTGRRAAVIGCGLGSDAEFVAGLGFNTTAFDIAPTAVRLAADRHPGSPVRYVTADLFNPPADWNRAFDLVVEIYTVQALPQSVRPAATAAVTRLVGTGGTLLVVQAIRKDGEPVEGPPWPLTRTEIEAFALDGMTAVRIEEVPYPPDPPSRRWRAEVRRH